MYKDKNEIKKFIIYNLVSLVIIAMFLGGIIFNLNVDENYISKHLVGFIFATFYIIASISFIVYNIIDFIKKVHFYILEDEEKDYKGLVFAIYLSSIYIVGVILAIVM